MGGFARSLRAALLCGALAVTGGVVHASTAGQDGPPRLRVDRESVKLGLVLRGELREAEFELFNDGGAPLVIHRVNTGCGCTVVDYDERIPPGGTGRIRATVDSNKFTGALTRPITLFTNDPSREVVRLFLEAVILGSVEVFPPQIKLSNVERVAPRESFFLVRKEPSERGELRIHDIRVDVPWIEVRPERLTGIRGFEGAIPPGREGDWVLHVRVEPNEDYGPSEHELSFRTGLPREPEVAAIVQTVIRPPVNVSSERLRLEPAPDGTVRRGTLMATVQRGLDPGQLEIEARPAGLQFEVERSGTRHLRLHVTWSPRAGAVAGELEFRIGGQRVVVPVDPGT